MLQKLVHRHAVLFRAFLDQAALQRPPDVQHLPVIQSLATHQDFLVEDFASHQIGGPPDIALDRLPDAIGRRDRTA